MKKTALLLFFLCLLTFPALKAQLNIQPGIRLSTGFSSYTAGNPIRPFLAGGFSPSFGLMGNLELIPQLALQSGLQLTQTIQQQNRFQNRFFWLGVPLELRLWIPWPEKFEARPYMSIGGEAGFLLQARRIGEQIYPIDDWTHAFRVIGLYRIGISLPSPTRILDLSLSASFSNPVNESYYFDSQNIGFYGFRGGLCLSYWVVSTNGR